MWQPGRTGERGTGAALCLAPRLWRLQAVGVAEQALRMRLQPQTRFSGWPQTTHTPPAPPGPRVIPSAILFTVALAKNRAPSSVAEGVHFQPFQRWAAPRRCAPLGRAGDVRGYELGCRRNVRVGAANNPPLRSNPGCSEQRPQARWAKAHNRPEPTLQARTFISDLPHPLPAWSFSV